MILGEYAVAEKPAECYDFANIDQETKREIRRWILHDQALMASIADRIYPLEEARPVEI
jgi:alpha-D-ribose 1-methylphosphonate 5-phosphate C-P lyase